jgi:von Willebrand factor type D domain
MVNIILSALDRCAVTGEPHYKTFSQCPFDYQGVCRHLLAATSSRYTGQNSFSIFLKNKLKNRSGRVAYVLYVETILRNGDIIRLTRVRSSGCRSIVPVTITVSTWKNVDIYLMKLVLSVYSDDCPFFH